MDESDPFGWRSHTSYATQKPKDGGTVFGAELSSVFYG
jgi:hypothetical protein